VILNPESNPSLLKSTVNSIRNKYRVPIISVTEKSVKAQNFKEMNEICPTCKGKETYTSLINAGLDSPPAEWNFIVIAGTYIKHRIENKYSMFIENEKDILFPIVDKKYEFVESTINGLLIHKNCLKEVGKMSEIGSYEVCKLMWTLDAIEKGYKFKAILGAKLC
jgi:hypothetical protein